MFGDRVRISVALSSELLAAVDMAVREGKAGSRSDFLDLAVRNQLAAEQRAHIDAQFAQMAHDPDFQHDAEEMANEFAEADWEATRVGESALSITLDLPGQDRLTV